MHKKLEINRTKIKGGCKSGIKVVTHNSKSDLPLDYIKPKCWAFFLFFFSFTSKSAGRHQPLGERTIVNVFYGQRA